MNNEFKKTTGKDQTVYTLESATAGGTGSGSIASTDGNNLLAQESDKKKVPTTTPRNFVAKNAKMGGAGAHKDKKKSEKQGGVKHKKPFMETLRARIDTLKSQLDEAGASPTAEGVAEGSDDIKTLQIDLWNLYKDVTGNRPRSDVVDWTREQWNDPEFLKGEIAKLSQQGVAEATGDEPFDKMMGKITGGADARQGVDSLNKSLTARTGSNPETALAKWGQEFIKWLEDICRNFAKQGADRISKLENLGNLDDGGETMAHWLIKVAKQSNTSGITLADIQEFSSEFNTHGMWAWQHFPIAWSQSEWQDYKDQWTGPDGYIASLGQGVAEGSNGEYDDEAGMAQSNLHTMARAVDGLLNTIENNDDLPEWCQEKLAKAEMMVTGVWDYLLSQKEQGIDPQQDMAEVAPKGWEGTVKSMKKHKDEIDNPWALAHWMKNKGYKSHKKEDAYMESLNSMLERQLEPTMDVDTWKANFQSANPNKYHQFKNKTNDKKDRMAIAARYASIQKK